MSFIPNSTPLLRQLTFWCECSLRNNLTIVNRRQVDKGLLSVILPDIFALRLNALVSSDLLEYHDDIKIRLTADFRGLPYERDVFLFHPKFLKRVQQC